LKREKISKTDKVILLSEKLDVSYDHMSLKLDNNLAPIGEILKSGILKEIPLIFFGIQENDLIDIIQRSAKVNYTIIEIAQHYNLSEREFLPSCIAFLSRNNYRFRGKVLNSQQPSILILTIKIVEELASILKEEYGYTIEELVFSEQEKLDLSLFCTKE
jgi:hypothetical protein